MSDYIRKIGLATENEAKLALFCHLEAEYSKLGAFQGDVPAALAGAVTNKVFGEEAAAEESREFTKNNPDLIGTYARRISEDGDLCRLLTGAAYNTCYGRYLRAGGKRKMFSNPFLAYIRANRDLTSSSNRQIAKDLYIEISTVSSHILEPMDAMQALGILRLLPHSPNEREFYNAVHKFARHVGVKFEE